MRSRPPASAGTRPEPAPSTRPRAPPTRRAPPPLSVPPPCGGSLAPGLRCAAPSRYRYLARSDHLDQPERTDHLLEGLDLVVGARDLHGHRALRDVHGL